jgi:putative tryptophan/tyrosine transport system substrate-binding protein
MKRREFIAELGAAVAWPYAVQAQQGERVRRVGVLTYGAETGVFTTPIRKLLRDDLEQLGWTEASNLRLDFYFGNGDATQTRFFASHLVQLGPEVIVTEFAVALRAAQRLTKTIPIIFAGAGDPVENGAVTNPPHPEGNVTGFANAFDSLGGKWMELLKEAAPNIARVAYMYPVGFPLPSYLNSVEAAARLLGVEVVAIPVSDAAAMKAAIEVFAVEPNGGLLPSPGMFAIAPDELLRLVAQYRLPAISGQITANSLLMEYGIDRSELYRGAASYVDRLLRGAKVSDLPVQYPTKFRLVVNLKTAKALGLVVPSSILVRADEVIE